MIKLHLGCGQKKIEGYINIDIQRFSNVDMVADISNLPFKKKSVDLIYSCANIEHFSRHEWKDVLKSWYDLLKIDGWLYLSTADFSAACSEYLFGGNDIEKLLGLIVGGQKDFTDRHGMIFDYRLLSDHLYKLGFRGIARYDWQDFEAFNNDQYDDYSRSYLPHLKFNTGRLMMLNLKARKDK